MPEPLCFLQGCAEKPALLVTLMDKVNALQGISLKPVIDLVDKLMEILKSVSWEDAVKAPLNKLSSLLDPKINDLETAISAAGKLASMGGEMPAAPAMPLAPAMPRKPKF